MSKGGSQKTEVKIPEWLEAAAQRGISRGEKTANVGYMPYYGPDVAAMSAPQQAAMQSTQSAAQAFGMAAPNPMAGMPQPQQFKGGVQGYSSGGLYDQALAELAKRNPNQFGAYRGLFVNPGRR